MPKNYIEAYAYFAAIKELCVTNQSKAHFIAMELLALETI